MAHIRLRSILACATAALVAGAPGPAKGLQRHPGQQGAQLYASNCAYCHGADGKGGRAPAIAVLPNVIAMSDQALIDVVHNGKIDQGMPGFPGLGTQGTEAVVRYLRQLQGGTGMAAPAKPTGNAVEGRQLFFGKGNCSSCHMINGAGGFIAQDLTGYAQNLTSHAVIRQIVNPDAHLSEGAEVVKVQTKSGHSVAGVLRAEDNMTLTLQSEDGRYHFLARRDLAQIQHTGHSLMPHYYGTRLTPVQLNDLATFLIEAAKGTSSDATSNPLYHHSGE